MTLPSEPVQTVRSESVLGARIMEGTWPDGETKVLIAPADPVDVTDARVFHEAGELPEVTAR
jgi:hypothetical protein